MVEAIFTRYLYYKNEVVNSLHWSLLEKQSDESLYWVYELYFSGFDEEAYFFVREFYRMYYQETYPEYERYIDMQYKNWTSMKTDHCIIGTIVKLLVDSNASLTNIMRIKQGVLVEKKTETNYDEFDVTLLSSAEIRKYLTLKLTKDMRCWMFLDKTACKYRIRRVICEDLLIHHPTVEAINFDSWLYYASYTPIWKKRISKYEGIIKNQEVIIEDEKFYDNYDYEPDEQSMQLKEMLWNNDVKFYVNLSICEFCEKYGQHNIYKKMSIRK